MKETKEPINMSISTFFLIIAVIAIIVMTCGIFYLFNEKNKAQTEVFSLNSKINEQNKIINEIQQLNNQVTDSTSTKEEKKLKTFAEIAGKYECNLEGNLNENIGFKFELNLEENGQFSYNCWAPHQCGSIGNYIIDGNTIIMNEIFETGSDISLGAMRKSELRLKINEDHSITDESNFISRVTANEVKSITLNKANNKDNKVNINDTLRSAIQEKALFLKQ